MLLYQEESFSQQKFPKGGRIWKYQKKTHFLWKTAVNKEQGFLSQCSSEKTQTENMSKKSPLPHTKKFSKSMPKEQYHVI